MRNEAKNVIDNRIVSDVLIKQPIRAMTFQEPFGSMILNGRIEVRKQKTDYRGLILICTGFTELNAVQLKILAGPFNAMRIRTIMTKNQMHSQPGKAIAVAELVDCYQMTVDDELSCFVPYHDRRWCYKFKNVRPILSRNWRGKAGISQVPEDFVESIEFLENY